MLISRPTLPPKEGYTEVIVNGVPQYKRISSKPTVDELQTENDLLRAQVTMLQSQTTFLEDCILEMADEVYA